MPGMSPVPAPQAVKSAADFLEVIKLAGSKDVAATIAEMAQINDETQAALAENQTTLQKIVTERGDLAKERSLLDVDVKELEAVRAAVAKDKQLAADDREKAIGVLADARNRATEIIASADKAFEDATKALSKANADASAAASSRAAAERLEAEAAALKKQLDERAARLNAALA